MSLTLPALTSSSLTFDDEFNTFVSSPDGSQGWQTSFPYGGSSARTLPGNNEAEFYADGSVGANPFSVQNGVLNIAATPAVPGSNPYGLAYNSGLITTYKSFSQLYGYFEVRAQLPAGNGLWPGFWLLPSNNVYSSELDAFEILGNDPTTLYATTHGSTNGVWGVNSQAVKIADASAGFHTYGVDWEPTTTTFYVDGQAIASAPTPASMNVPMYMLLQLAVGGGGSWPGAPTSASEFPANLKIDYVRAYATANTLDVSGPSAISGATPLSAPVLTAPAPATVGSGPDQIVLHLSEDAWSGDAQYRIAVDGVPVGGVMTQTASHAQGQYQVLTLNGDWGAGRHRVSVDFLNDAYGGTTAKDRNLYLDAASYDGTQVAAGTLSLYGAGWQTLTVTAPQAGGAVGDPASVSIGSGADTIALGISEDAWAGDARFTVSVDGQQVGGTQVATASDTRGQDQTFDIQGNWGGGPHQVTVNYINDAYGGSKQTDRNLFVDSATYDGVAAPVGTLALYGQGPQTLTIGAPVIGDTITLGRGPDTLALKIAEDAWQSDVQFTVSVDGVQVGGVQTATASHATGQDVTYNLTGSWGAGPHVVGVDFLNDLYGGAVNADRNLYVDSASYDGVAASPGTLTLWGNGTQTLDVNSSPPAPTTVPGQGPVQVPGQGPDTISIGISEDAWMGNAQFIVSVDGKTVGGLREATASHAAGQDQILDLTGDWGAGAHLVAVDFLNDAYGGSPQTDRNLYVDSLSYDGRAVTPGTLTLWTSGTQSIAIPAASIGMGPHAA